MSHQWLEFLERPVGKLLLAALAILVFTAFGRQFMAIHTLNKEIAVLERDKSRLTEEYETHEEVLKSYETPQFIETYARENLEMIYPDEVRMMPARYSEDLKETAGRTEEILH